jgi:oligopeptide transport system substrate-binding protein
MGPFFAPGKATLGPLHAFLESKMVAITAVAGNLSPVPPGFRLAVITVAFVSVAGCRRESRVESGARGQILHLGNGAEPKALDPGQMEAEVEYTIESALFEGLTNIANDGETILPGVAERWDVSPDGKTYTFHLRPDARWSDGSPVTADDFAFAFRRVFTPTLLSQGNIGGFPIVGAQETMGGQNVPLGVRALDARTLQIQLKFPTPYILYIVAGAPFDPVPRAVVEKFGDPYRAGSPWSRPGNMVSNGAFQLTAWRPNQDVIVTRNPYYWDQARVRLKEVHFYPTDNVESEERSFRTGDLHLTYRLPASKIAVYQDRHDPQLRITPQLDSVFVFFNTKKRPFDDVRVRRAFALAIDRDRIVPLVTHGEFSPGHALTRPGTAGYQPAPVVDYLPDEARRLLAQAGFPGGAGFPAVNLRNRQGNKNLLAEALQEAWRRVLGVSVGIEVEEQKVFFSDMEARNYDLALHSFFYGIQAPETMLMMVLPDSPGNFADWKSPAFAEAFRDANEAPVPGARRAAYDRMERLIQDEAAYVPFAYHNQAHLISPMVKGWRENALYVIDWREIWLEP